jgi:hypothetical protein
MVLINSSAKQYTEPVPKPQANLRTTLFIANLQENLTAKAPNAVPETGTTVGCARGVGAVMQHGTAPIKAALGYQLRRRGTEGAEGLCRHPRLLPPIRLLCQLSQEAAFKTACKASRLSNQRASILIRLSGEFLTSLSTDSNTPIQMSFGTGSTAVIIVSFISHLSFGFVWLLYLMRRRAFFLLLPKNSTLGLIV